jgi:hypothetical protein
MCVVFCALSISYRKDGLAISSFLPSATLGDGRFPLFFYKDIIMNSYAVAKRAVSTLFFISLMSLSSFFKFSFVVGSWRMFFSALNCVGPIAGSFLGVSGSWMIYGLRTVVRLCTMGVTAAQLLNGVPTLCASLYLATTHWAIACGLPLTCMVLFWLHPVGVAAAPYALYWLIPVAVFYVQSNNLFFKALGSTFVAHAVGSIIWLYTVPMTSAAWLALIPVVAVERLLFATGMVIVQYVIQAIVSRISVVEAVKRILSAA